MMHDAEGPVTSAPNKRRQDTATNRGVDLYLLQLPVTHIYAYCIVVSTLQSLGCGFCGPALQMLHIQTTPTSPQLPCGWTFHAARAMPSV